MGKGVELGGGSLRVVPRPCGAVGFRRVCAKLDKGRVCPRSSIDGPFTYLCSHSWGAVRRFGQSGTTEIPEGGHLGR